jgi:hypothetical protein
VSFTALVLFSVCSRLSVFAHDPALRQKVCRSGNISTGGGQLLTIDEVAWEGLRLFLRALTERQVVTRQLAGDSELPTGGSLLAGVDLDVRQDDLELSIDIFRSRFLVPAIHSICESISTEAKASRVTFYCFARPGFFTVISKEGSAALYIAVDRQILRPVVAGVLPLSLSAIYAFERM